MERREALGLGQHRRGQPRARYYTFSTDGSKNVIVTAELLDRPLSARSLIASLLLGMQPAADAGRAGSSQWCGLFGVAEGTARVALSRMVERGELRARDGVYELAGRVRRRQPAQDWSLAPRARARGTASGGSAIVRAGRARTPTERAALRDAMRRLRMVELREGVWSRPDNLPRASAPDGAWDVADAQCHVVDRPSRRTTRQLAAAELFAPEAWADRARMLRRRLDAATDGTSIASDGAAIADAFVVGAAALAHVRADPLLPAELCGRDGPAPRATVPRVPTRSATRYALVPHAVT